MADKFTNMPKRIRQLLVVAFADTAADGERAKALREFDQYLKSIGTDGYEVIEKIETPSISDEEMQRVFDTGREEGHAEAVEQQRNTAPTAPRPFFSSNLGSVTRSSVYGFDDRDRIAGSDIHNGYQWRGIAEHCAANLNRVPTKHHGFIEDMASKLAGYSTVSGAQAKYLGNLFNQYLSGRI
jgi:hypothetical protein